MLVTPGLLYVSGDRVLVEHILTPPVETIEDDLTLEVIVNAGAHVASNTSLVVAFLVVSYVVARLPLSLDPIEFIRLVRPPVSRSMPIKFGSVS